MPTSTDNSAVSISGNTGILPQINHDVDATLYIGNLQLSAGVTHHKNFISTLIAKNEGSLTQQYNNFGFLLPYSFIGYQRKINRLWTVRNYANVFLPIVDFRNIESSGSTWAWNNRIVNTLALENGIAAEVSFLFFKKYSDGYFVHHAHNNLFLTVQKKLKKPNLLLYLTAEDLLKGTNGNFHSLYGGLNYVSKGYGDTRNVKIGAYWSFGNQKVRVRDKKPSGLEEFTERL